MNTVMIETVYGPAKPDVEYEVLEEGFDYVRVKCRGKPIYFPNYLLTRPTHKRHRENLKTYEQIIEEDNI
jgi:hypothetical protein